MYNSLVRTRRDKSPVSTTIFSLFFSILVFRFIFLCIVQPKKNTKLKLLGNSIIEGLSRLRVDKYSRKLNIDWEKDIIFDLYFKITTASTILKNYDTNKVVTFHTTKFPS